jgi:hypothetical protein
VFVSIILDTGSYRPFLLDPPVADSFASAEEEKPATPRVTRANYREVARDFDGEQLRRLAALMRRHDSETCEECCERKGRRGRPACNFAFEAVEAVALYVEQAQAEGDYYPRTDWNQNSYAALGESL